MGAALAYYALFSIAPLFVIAVTVTGWIFGKEAALRRLQFHLTENLGTEGAAAITSLMSTAHHPARGTIAAVIGSVTLVIGALGVFLHMRRCLNIIWQLDVPKGNSVLATVLNYVLAVVMVLCTGAVLLLSVALSTAMPAIRDFMGAYLPGSGFIWPWLEAGVSFLLLALFFAITFRVMSARRISWRHIWHGALITAMLFTVGKTLIGLYLAYTGTASTYGAAGSLVAVMIWIYYSSQITFLGAEIIQARRTYWQWQSEREKSQAA